MATKLLVYRVALAILVVSLCAQLAGMASDGWIVLDMEQTSETYNIGLYYAKYCKDGDCDTYYIEDLPAIDGYLYDRQAMVFRVGTALGAAFTIVAIIFLSRLTTQCCADCQTCASFDNHLICIHGFTLAGGLLALSAAAHIGNRMGAHSIRVDYYEVPYSVILTGIGGLLALVVFFIVVISICKDNDSKDVVVAKPRKYISPDEYFEKADLEAYIAKEHRPAPAPVMQVVNKPPSYASSGRTYTDFMAEPPRRTVEYINMPERSQVITPYRQPRPIVHSSGPNVYHVTLRKE